MDRTDLAQIFAYVLSLVALSPPLGFYVAWALDRPRPSRTEIRVARIAGFDLHGMDWKGYARALLAFNACGFAVVFGLQVLQRWLWINPDRLSNVSWHSALNTAVSFVTNTNWQGYAGETTLSHMTQALGLGVQNFASAATGIAVLMALVRGLRNRSSGDLGNFWLDAWRSTAYILLPLSIALSAALLQQGVVQSWNPAHRIRTLEGHEQVVPVGPAASQVAIKQLGTNGGGFFNANSAHPFENPTPWTNFLEMLSILLIPSALVFAFGKMLRQRRHAWVLFAVMMGFFVASLAGALAFEYGFNPILGKSALMEGKEVRFGVAGSVLWSTATSLASNGSVNAMHASLSPAAGGLAMFNIMLGEIVFGGVGSGLYGMILFVLLTVFLVGLMVGRTPEYLGKKIETREIRMAILGILLPCATILVGTALSCLLEAGLSSRLSRGPHGFSEILYAFTSAAGNNGSAFAGLNANTPYYNVALAIAMLIGRYGVILPVLYVAGHLGSKKASPAGAGTFSAEGATFALLLAGVILIVGALTFLPALSLGPIVEQLLMSQGRAS